MRIWAFRSTVQIRHKLQIFYCIYISFHNPRLLYFLALAIHDYIRYLDVMIVSSLQVLYHPFLQSFTMQPMLLATLFYKWHTFSSINLHLFNKLGNSQYIGCLTSSDNDVLSFFTGCYWADWKKQIKKRSYISSPILISAHWRTLPIKQCTENCLGQNWITCVVTI